MKSRGNKLRRLKLAGKGSGQFKFNSFFAGIGGFDLAFERSGISPSFHCEINKYCQSVLKRHWPQLPLSSDINNIKVEDLPEAEVWCGGFPCQDVSVARGWLGRDGLKGKNSGLFFPFLELVEQKLPQVVLLENVTGLLSSHEGNDFKTIIKSFTDIGYGVAWRVVNARYFGAPQSRPRIFICAWKGRPDLALHSLYEAEGGGIVKNARKGFITPTKCKNTGAHVPLVGYCLAATSGRHTGTDWSRTYVAYTDSVRRLTPTECEGLQGFPVGWSLPETDYPSSDDDIDTLRYHAIGNAVCVPVVGWFAARIVAGLSGEHDIIDALDQEPPQELNILTSSFDDFRKASPMQLSSLELKPEKDSSKFQWSSGGLAYDDWYFSNKVSPAPNTPVEKRLLRIIETKKVDEKYFLSPNAATGILRRVNSQGRTLFKPLEKALIKLSRVTKASESSSLDVCSNVACM